MASDLDGDSTRPAWIAGGGLLALVLVFVVYSFIGTFVFGLFLYYATRPVYDRLRHRTNRRSVAAAASILAIALPVLLLFVYTLAVGLQEANSFAGNNNLSQFQGVVGPYLNASAGVTDPGQILQDPGTFVSSPGIRDLIGQLVGPLLNSLGFVGTALLNLFIMVVLAYYLLKDGRRLSRWVRGKFGDDRGVMAEFFLAVDRDFQNIFFGNLLNAFLTAIIGALSYSALNALVAPDELSIPYAALVGVLTGVGSLIPVVGMKIVYFPVAAYLGFVAYMSGPGLLWFPVVFVVVSLVLVDLIPDLVLRPYVSGRELHLGAVMLAYTLGPLIWGWYGIFLGPVLLVLVVHFAKIVVPELVSERRFAPYAIDPGQMPASFEEQSDPDPKAAAVDPESPEDEPPGS